MKKRISFVIKLGFSVILLTLFFSRLDLDAVLEIILQIEIPFYFLSLFIYFATVFVSTKRWSLFLPKGLQYLKLVSLYFIGSFFNTFLPGIIGGDAVKTYYLYRETGEGGLSVAAVFMDRYMGLIALALIAFFGLLTGYSYVKDSEVLWYLLAFLGGITLGSFFLWKLNWGRIQFLRSFYAPLMEYKERGAIIVHGLALGLIVQGMNILSVYFVSIALGIKIPLIFFLMFIPMITLLSALPISIAGLGIREAGYIMLFPQAGVTPEEALSLSLLVFIKMSLVHLLGGLEYLRIGKVKAP